MKTPRAILVVTALLMVQSHGGAGPATVSLTHAPACIQLHDQFNALQKLSFPKTNLTLLTIADGRGSEQIPGWVNPVKERFDGRIDICGIADMSHVPGPLRIPVRAQFRLVQHYPVMLDWTGNVVNAFACQPGAAGILVLDRNGKILYRARGPATEQGIRNLCGAIDQALSAETPEASAK